jgi:molecular chaperone GrpE (heat shock protein)
MGKNQLQESLAELHESLAKIDRLDEETRQLMQRLTADLQRLLGQAGDLSAEDVEPVTNNLQELLLRFETEHPQITGILGRLASSLANLGI